MVRDLYGTLLEELGRTLQVRDLHADRNNSCLIRLKNGLQVQIEISPKTNMLLLGVDLGAPPLGRFRVDLFKQALKANGMPYPQHGIFSQSSKTDHLILYEFLPLKDLTGDKIADELGPFSEKALLWKNSLAQNEIPSLEVSGERPSLGMFGLRP